MQQFTTIPIGYTAILLIILTFTNATDYLTDGLSNNNAQQPSILTKQRERYVNERQYSLNDGRGRSLDINDNVVARRSSVRDTRDFRAERSSERLTLPNNALDRSVRSAERREARGRQQEVSRQLESSRSTRQGSSRLANQLPLKDRRQEARQSNLEREVTRRIRETRLEAGQSLSSERASRQNRQDHPRSLERQELARERTQDRREVTGLFREHRSRSSEDNRRQIRGTLRRNEETERSRSLDRFARGLEQRTSSPSTSRRFIHDNRDNREETYRLKTSRNLQRQEVFREDNRQEINRVRSFARHVEPQQSARALREDNRRVRASPEEEQRQNKDTTRQFRQDFTRETLRQDNRRRFGEQNRETERVNLERSSRNLERQDLSSTIRASRVDHRQHNERSREALRRLHEDLRENLQENDRVRLLERASERQKSQDMRQQSRFRENRQEVDRTRSETNPSRQDFARRVSVSREATRRVIEGKNLSSRTSRALERQESARASREDTRRVAKDRREASRQTIRDIRQNRQETDRTRSLERTMKSEERQDNKETHQETFKLPPKLLNPKMSFNDSRSFFEEINWLNSAKVLLTTLLLAQILANSTKSKTLGLSNFLNNLPSPKLKVM